MKNSLFIILLLLFIITSQAREYTVIDIVGDSISHGINPEDQGNGWVQMLYKENCTPEPGTLQTLWPNIEKNNNAVSGSTAELWAADDSPLLQKVLDNNPDLVVVFIGANDLLINYITDGKFTEAEKSEYQNNLRAIITHLQENTPKPDIIVVNYYDLFDGLSNNIPTFLNYEEYKILSAATVEGNLIVKQVSNEKGCHHIDIYTDFMHHCYGVDIGDTQHLTPDYVDRPIIPNFDIHPITAGHAKIKEKVFTKLQEFKNILPPTPSGFLLH